MGAAVGSKGATGARGSNGRGGRGSGVASPAQFEKKEIPRFDNPRFKHVLDEVDEVGSEIIALQKEIAEIQESINDKRIVIHALMESVNNLESWSVQGDEWTASYIKPKPSKKIVRELLIQQGVTMKQIEKATKETPKKPYVQIKARGESGGSNEETEEE